MSKREDQAADYAKETQIFQRIVGTPETPTHELVADFLSFTRPRRERMLNGIRAHNVIARMAKKAGDRC